MKATRNCSAAGCTRPAARYKTAGMVLCGAHAHRLRRWGHVGADIPIQVKEGLTFTEGMDRARRGDDECWPWQGVMYEGYGKVNVNGRQVFAHRHAYIEANGPIDEGLQIDHICRNPACVNPRHLRAVTSGQNSQNQAVESHRAKSGWRGVHWMKRKGKWKGVVKLNGRQHHVGTFDNAEDARDAVIAARIRLHAYTVEDLAWMPGMIPRDVPEPSPDNLANLED